MKQRIDEIDADERRDDEADEGFEHGVSSQACAEARIERDQREENGAEGEIGEIEHHSTPIFEEAWAICRKAA
jgi:hypothetical protein